MKTSDHSSSVKIEYKDRGIRIAATVLAAHIVTEYGGNEPWLPRLLTKAYYIEFGSTFLITLLLVECIYRITCYLDKRYPWDKKLMVRTILQFLLGIITPTMGAFLLAAGYFAIYNYNILDTNYHLFALPFIAALITLFNVYYFVRFLLIKGGHFKPTPENYESHLANTLITDLPDAPAKTYNEREETVKVVNSSANTESALKEVFIVNTPLQSIPVRMEDISCFYRSNGINYVRTFDQTINEAHVITQTLKEVEEQLNPNQFFRINRQMIVSFKSCVSFRNGKGKGIELTISPNYVDGEDGMKTLPYVMVSEDRAQGFKAWIDR